MQQQLHERAGVAGAYAASKLFATASEQPSLSDLGAAGKAWYQARPGTWNMKAVHILGACLDGSGERCEKEVNV